MDYHLTFGSTHKALKAEKVLKAAKVKHRLNPAPKELEKYCALVITIDSETFKSTALALLENDLVPPKDIFTCCEGVYKKI